MSASASIAPTLSKCARSALGVGVGFAAENLIAVEGEPIEKVLRLARSLLNERRERGFDGFKFPRMSFEVGVQTDEVRERLHLRILHRATNEVEQSRESCITRSPPRSPRIPLSTLNPQLSTFPQQLTESPRASKDTPGPMHITDIMQGDSPTFSFEFFPPQTPEAAESLYQTIRELEAYMPHFVSVTYGAGGSTRDLTHDLVERIQTTTKLDPIPHLTCVCHKQEEIEAILTSLRTERVSETSSPSAAIRRAAAPTTNRPMSFNTRSIW